MKIFFVHSRLSLGGAEKMAYEVIKGLDRSRFQLKVCCLYSPGTIGKKLLSEGIDMVHSLMQDKYDLAGIYRLFFLLKKERPDVLHLESSPLVLFWGYLCARLLKIPHTVTVIHTMRKPEKWERFKSGIINRLLLRRLDRIGVVSRLKMESLITDYGIDPCRLYLIHNAVDIDRFSKNFNTDELKKEIGLSDKNKVVGMIGRLVVEKAYDVFLRSAQRIAALMPDTRFLIIGNGGERNRLEDIAGDLGLKEHVLFLGERQDIPELISLFDVAVLSSRIESFPVSLLEYMASAKGIVATGVGDNSRIIKNNESGIIVPSEDPEAISERVLELLRDSDKARRFGMNAKKRVEEKFSLKTMIKNMEDFFQKQDSMTVDKHIVIVGPDLKAKGGVSSFAKNYLCSKFPKGLKAVYHPTTVDGNVVLKTWFFIKSLVRFFIRLLTDKNIAIVHILSGSKGSFCRKAIMLLVSRLFARPVVFHIHGAGFDVFYRKSNTAGKVFIKKILDLSDSIIVLSQTWHSEVSRMTKNKNIKIIPNPIDATPFSYINGNRDFLSMNILTAGRLEERKGTYDILDIVPVVTREIPEARFYLAGDGDVEKIKKICIERGIDKNIVLLGWLSRERLLEEFERAALFLLPSYHEGQPIAILEAMASGLPVISTKVGGIPEVVEDGVNGFLVEAGEKQDLARKIIRLLKDTELSKTMSRNNIEKIDSVFRLDRVVNGFFEEYKNLLTLSQPRRLPFGNLRGCGGKDIRLSVKKWIWRKLREGRPFKNMFARIMEIDKFSRKDIKKLQMESLKDVIRYSYSNVPYYKRLFDEAGININGKFREGDLEKIPFLTRDKILRNPDDFISRRSKKIFLRKSATSGTTGTPIVLYRDLYSVNFENAILWKQRNWAGIRPGDKKVILRGDIIMPVSSKRPPFWKCDFLGKELMLSAFHISRDTVPYYVNVLRDFKPVYIEAYSSSLYILAKFIKESGLKGVSFKSAILSSETLHDYKKKLIEEVFNCKVYDFYGNAERVAAIATCPEGNLHVLPEYGLVEFIDCKDREGYKEIIGTSFINMSMPLIRYRTGDVVIPSEKECKCGRKSQMIDKIIGRLSEFVITPEGRYVGMMDCLYKGLKNFIEAQLIQEDRKNIRVKVVPDVDFSATDEANIIERVRVRVGCGMNISVEKVDSIRRTGNDKFRSVVSKLKDKGI